VTGGVQRHLRVVAYAAGSLRRRWRKNLAVAAVYALVIFALASVVFLARALTEAAQSTLRGSPEILVQRLQAGRHGLFAEDDAASFAGIAGVRSVVPRRWAYHADPDRGELLLLRVPDHRAPRRLEAVAGEALLRRRGIREGGLLTLRGFTGEPVPLTIAAIAASDRPLESAAEVRVSGEAFEALTGMPEGLATDLAVRVRNRRELATVAAKITRIRPDARPVLRDELFRTYASVFDWRAGVSIAALLVPVLAFILFAWDKAAGLSPEERREIGILKAIGWETGDVILFKGYEAAAVSLAAFAAGAGLAVAGSALSSAPAVLPALLGWSTLYPQFRPAPAVGPYQIATVFFLAVFPYLAATVVPTWRAATTDPDRVMRG